MNQMVKNTLSLFVITAVTGILLGTVYEGTKDARAQQALKTENQAYQNVFAKADDFKAVEEEKLADAIAQMSYSEKEVEVNKAVEALDKDGTRIGYVVSVTAKEGYDGDISFTVGVNLEQKVTGISYLEISETPGLGMKAKEDSFIAQFVDKSNIEEGGFVVNKDGQDGCVIDAISGATITSRAVTKGVNVACEIAQSLCEGGMADE